MSTLSDQGNLMERNVGTYKRHISQTFILEEGQIRGNEYLKDSKFMIFCIYSYFVFDLCINK